MPSSITTQKRALFWLELASTVLLGVAAIATSWSAYQASRWSGLQATKFNQAGALRIESTRGSTTGNHQRTMDLALFAGWLEAYARNQSELSDFYKRKFRTEFATAFDAWVATDPRGNPNAAPSPFALPEYRLAAEEESARLLAKAEAVATEAQTASEQGDRYVLNAVVFATALFFLGIAQPIRAIASRATIVALAFVLCAYGIVLLGTYPIE